MALLWTGHISVGIKQFDDDHRLLIKYVNELQNAIREGEAKGRIDPVEMEIVLHRMFNYARGHCLEEERLMEKTGFPGLAAHHAEHGKFLNMILEMSEKFQGSTDLGHARQIADFLYNWITEHIFRMDRAYSEHLRARGIF
jgi:hemerythrin-like metal-binding protein